MFWRLNFAMDVCPYPIEIHQKIFYFYYRKFEKIIKTNKWKYTKSIRLTAYIGWPRGGPVGERMAL